MKNLRYYIVVLLLLVGVEGAFSASLKSDAPIDKAVDKGVSFVAKKAKSWFGKSKKGKEKVNKKVVDEQAKKEEQDKKNNKKGTIKPIEFSMSGASHKLSFDNDKVYMASLKRLLATKLSQQISSIEKSDLEKKDYFLNMLKRMQKLNNSYTTRFNKAKDQSDLDKIRPKFIQLGNLISKFGDKHKLKDLEGLDVGPDSVAFKKGDAISVKRKSKWYAASIATLNDNEKKVGYEFAYKKMLSGTYTENYEDFNALVKEKKIGEYQASVYQKRVAQANAEKEPLRTLILGTISGYRSNLLSDLEDLLKTQGGRAEFQTMYANASGDFQTKLKAIIGEEKISKSELEDLFKGFEAHHVIPANFLRNNATVKELMMHVEFGYNDLDNLIFVHSENHTTGKQRGHPEYDIKIQERIEERVAPLVREQKYEEAIAVLKRIVKNVKNKFIKEIIGSSKDANDA